MGRNPHQDAIMAVRQSEAGDSEPIIDRTRSAVPNGDSVRANLTKEGRDILEIEPGDDLSVQVYHDHIRIYPADQSED